LKAAVANWADGFKSYDQPGEKRMAMKRTGQPWMPAADYGRTLTGLGVNLLVTDIARQLKFSAKVLGATVVYSDLDFAVLTACSSEWMLHADHTYNDHPMRGVVEDLPARGAGLEIRLHGRDPDLACEAARELGYTVLQDATDKPHGLREAYIVGPDGYIWVADTPLG